MEQKKKIQKMLKEDQDKNGRKLNVEIKKGKFYDAKIKEDHIYVERMLSKVKKTEGRSERN